MPQAKPSAAEIAQQLTNAFSPLGCDITFQPPSPDHAQPRELYVAGMSWRNRETAWRLLNNNPVIDISLCHRFLLNEKDFAIGIEKLAVEQQVGRFAEIETAARQLAAIVKEEEARDAGGGTRSGRSGAAWDSSRRPTRIK